ncbi:hypothetical protein VTP01DRAFT_4303 [Rhizomucor pusillus]|uniref:uncharacterized protein n=1 Tax=Rhizomucor pusillus TaxID=4840 RepID=UPI0037445324
MAKETTQPKAVNIIRPTHSFTPGKASRASSVHSVASYTSAPPTTTTTTRKPRVSSRIHDGSKPIINIYHPPSQQPSSHPQRRKLSPPPPSSPIPPPQPPANSRPHFEIYKPRLPVAGLQRPSRRPSNSSSSSDGYRARSVLMPIAKPVNWPPHSSTPTSSSMPLLMPENVKVDEPMFPSDETDDDQDDEEEENDDSFEEDDNQHEDDEDASDSDDPVVNEARVNRKIADLEISNQSLLAVNAMLEATVRKQASQVAKLKKQISSDPQEVVVAPVLLADATKEQLTDEDDWEKDEAFVRLCRMTEKMIEQGRAALNFEFKGQGRVLAQYQEQDSSGEEEDEDDDTFSESNNNNNNNTQNLDGSS